MVSSASRAFLAAVCMAQTTLRPIFHLGSCRFWVSVPSFAGVLLCLRNIQNESEGHLAMQLQQATHGRTQHAGTVLKVYIAIVKSHCCRCSHCTSYSRLKTCCNIVKCLDCGCQDHQLDHYCTAAAASSQQHSIALHCKVANSAPVSVAK